jgi:hypothetical protein
LLALQTAIGLTQDPAIRSYLMEVPTPNSR